MERRKERDCASAQRIGTGVAAKGTGTEHGAADSGGRTQADVSPLGNARDRKEAGRRGKGGTASGKRGCAHLQLQLIADAVQRKRGNGLRAFVLAKAWAIARQPRKQ